MANFFVEVRTVLSHEIWNRLALYITLAGTLAVRAAAPWHLRMPMSSYGITPLEDALHALSMLCLEQKLRNTKKMKPFKILLHRCLVSGLLQCHACWNPSR